MRPAKGFTIVELMITLAVAAVLLAIAIPSFREVTLNNQRAAKTNEFVTALNYARGQALALRNPVIICRTSDSNAATPTCGSGNGWEEGWIIAEDRDADGDIDANDIANQDIDGDGRDDLGPNPMRRHGPLASSSELAKAANTRLTLRGNRNVASQITFFDNGAVSGPTGTFNGTLVICDSRDDFKKARAVTISNSGRVVSFDTHLDRGTGARDSRLSASVTDCIR